MFETRELTPFGIEILGDLDREFSDEERAEFRRLFYRHGLILARGQRLSREANERLGELIAPIVHNGDQETISNINPDDTFKSSALAYHYDNYYSPHPHLAVSLYAVDVTPDTTTTRFANTVKSAQDFPDQLRRRCDGRMVRNILSTNNPGRNYLDDQPTLENCEWPQRWWPILDEHPVTGETFVTANENLSDAVDGLDFAQSEDLLDQIFAHIYAPNRIFEHSWIDGDVIIWDNFSVQHGRSEVPDGIRRVLQRVSIGGKGFFDMHREVADQLAHYAL